MLVAVVNGTLHRVTFHAGPRRSTRARCRCGWATERPTDSYALEDARAHLELTRTKSA